MKYRHLFWLLCLLSFIAACGSQKRGGKSVKDSVEFYEVPIEARHAPYLHLLAGRWNMTTMKRQAAMKAENLTNVYLEFREDSTFAGHAGCNGISGKVSLKGASIKFGNVLSTKMACDKLEQENAFLQLLQNTVSAFTVDKNKLLLRDVAGNVVFEGQRKRGG